MFFLVIVLVECLIFSSMSFSLTSLLADVYRPWRKAHLRGCHHQPNAIYDVWACLKVTRRSLYSFANLTLCLWLILYTFVTLLRLLSLQVFFYLGTLRCHILPQLWGDDWPAILGCLKLMTQCTVAVRVFIPRCPHVLLAITVVQKARLVGLLCLKSEFSVSQWCLPCNLGSSSLQLINFMDILVSSAPGAEW